MVVVCDWLKTVEDVVLAEAEAPATLDPGPDPADVTQDLDQGQRASRSPEARADPSHAPSHVTQGINPNLPARRRNPDQSRGHEAGQSQGTRAEAVPDQ